MDTNQVSIAGRGIFSLMMFVFLCNIPAAQCGGTSAREICPTSPGNPRNGPASVIQLKDGSLLMAYAKFTGKEGRDHSAAYIAGKISPDRGNTWSRDFVLQPNDGELNVMSPSLLRLKSGKILLAYLRKNKGQDCCVHFRLSSDEGRTWGDEKLAMPSLKYRGYYVQNNDRMIQLSTGRILSPVAYCLPDWFLVCFVFCSDDDGTTWHRSRSLVQVPTMGGAGEPGVVELKDGRVMMIFRNYGGYVGQSFSEDGGITWSPGEMIKQLPAPQSPATVKRIPKTGDLLMIWNHNTDAIPWHYGDPVISTQARRRSPLTSAISRDDGKIWENFRNIEGVERENCYTSILFMGDEVLLTFKRKGVFQRRLPIKWFYEKR